MATPLQSRALHAVAGILATVTGMAAGHLVASLIDPSSSPVLAVGSTVIDYTPTPVKTWAISTFGTADKPILIGSVIVVTLLLAALAGILARTRLVLGTALLLVLVAAAGVAAMLQPTAGVLDLLPALVTAATGVAVFLLLVTRVPGRPASTEKAASGASTAPAAGAPSDPATDADRPDVMVPTRRGARADRTHTRRGFLIIAGVTTAAAAVMGGAGQLITNVRTRISDIALPGARDPLPPLPTGVEERGGAFSEISELQTDRADFYRVDINLTVPIVDQDSWTLTVDGDVAEPYTITFDELLEMPMVERDITMTCVSNNVGGPYVGAARWLGVPMADILERARPDSGADCILSTSVDGFTISTPLEVTRDGRECLVVVGMNGEPLPREHGFPVRMVTSGIYGYVGSTKWLERLTLTRFEDTSSYWTDRGWDEQAPIKISSRIDTPAPLGRVPAGEVVVGGVAWAQPVGVAKVEVQIDGGPWTECELGPAVDDSYWRQWYYVWDADPGQHRIFVRATDRNGEVQTDVQAPSFPNGSSGLHNIVMFVE